MAEAPAMASRFHEDAELFREAVNYTAAETGFLARLIEKDYFCTLLLGGLTGALPGVLVFKGGTCLAKVYAGFHRLSEDLDFSLPMEAQATRKVRSRAAQPMKAAVAGLPQAFPCFSVAQPMRGAYHGSHYDGEVRYTSLVSVQPEAIRIEVSLREPLLSPAEVGEARTILLNPVRGQPVVPAVTMLCLSRREAYAEKFRAALTRPGPAIRDFFDLDHAVLSQGLNHREAELVAMVRRKIAIPGNPPVDVSAARLGELRGQVEPRLRPVLRERDFQLFDLDRAFAMATDMAQALG